MLITAHLLYHNINPIQIGGGGEGVEFSRPSTSRVHRRGGGGLKKIKRNEKCKNKEINKYQKNK